METNKAGLERELLKWWEQEKRLGAIFPPALLQSRDFQKEKLKNFNLLLSKFSGVRDSPERLLLRVLHLEIKRMERALFPGRISRIFWKTFGRSTPKYSLFENKDKLAMKSKTTEAMPLSLEPGLKELTGLPGDVKKEKTPEMKGTKTIADLLPKKSANQSRGLNVK